MDDFLEGSLSEDSNGLDNGEAEAALYSLVHHSEDTYGTNVLKFNGSYVSQRNKANRWEMLKQISDSVRPENYILHPPDISRALDHIPIGDNNIASESRAMYGKQYNKRGQCLKYAWNNRRNEKPWNVQDRIRNNYHKNRNLVPIYVEGKQNDQQHTFDAQELLKISHFSSFENPRSDSCEDSPLCYESNKGVVETVMYKEYSYSHEQETVSNDQSEMNQNRNVTGSRINPYHGLLTDFASTSKDQSAVGKAVERIRETARKESNILLEQNSRKKANVLNVRDVYKNVTEVVDITSENITDEVVIISDTDGNDYNSDTSILEVSAPPKSLPPLIALDSSDETESLINSNATLVLNVSGNSDKSAIGELNSSQNALVSSENTKKSLDVCATSKEIKKKKKNKQHKRVKLIECETWTTGMTQFYNQSWGGETYDHEKLQQKMTNNPSKWKILDVDKYGPIRDYGPLARIRCANCNQFGHMAKQCSDPKKIKCCSMCGERGHGENQCPNKICLKCGRSAPLFNEGCPSCWNKDHPKKCFTCGGDDHFKWLCPDIWRKLHSITTAEEFQAGVLQETVYKSPKELNCCFCAGKGHVATKCPFTSKQHMPQPTFNSFNFMKLLNKKRKKKRNTYFEGKDSQQEFNRKRRKTN